MRGLTQLIFLGEAALVERVQTQVPAVQKADRAFPIPQRLSGRNWAPFLALCDGKRNQALRVANREAGSHVSRLNGETEKLNEGKWET
jgi:hypothetical protein